MTAISEYEKIILSEYPTATVEYCEEYGVPDGLIEHLEAKWLINCALSNEEISILPKSKTDPIYSVEQYVLKWVISDKDKYNYYQDTVKSYFDLEKLNEIESKLDWEYNSLSSAETEEIKNLITKIGLKKMLIVLTEYCKKKKMNVFQLLLSSIVNLK